MKLEVLWGKFCKDNGISLPIPFEAATVIMNVQSLERTFIDKIFAICDYRIQNMHGIEIRAIYMISVNQQKIFEWKEYVNGKILWNIQQFIMTWTKDSVTQLIRICL